MLKNSQPEPKYIEFVKIDVSDSGKTDIYGVRTKDGAETIGVISWFGRWRCYAFTPKEDTVFEKQCLRDIANFCENVTTIHRLANKEIKKGEKTQ